MPEPSPRSHIRVPQYHYWEKARARRGKRQQVWDQPPANGRRRKSGDAGLVDTHAANSGKVVVVRIEENMKSRVTFCFMVLTTFCTMVTTTAFLLS